MIAQLSLEPFLTLPVAALTDVCQLEASLISSKMRHDVINSAVPDHGMQDKESLENDDSAWLTQAESQSATHICEGPILREGRGQDWIDVLWL